MSNILFILFVCLYLIVTITCNKNNVCPTYRDYYNKESNPHCWYDPDVFSEAVEIINRYSYTYEVYTTVTADGYILNVYRLPPKREKAKGLVFLAHSAVANMIQWVDKGNESAAFQLVEAGYDVYLGNFRGALYSQQHVNMSRYDHPTEFFNYSFHELGIYDLPAQLELIRNVSGSSSKIHYIGYSWGSTIAFIYASMLPEHAREYMHLFILWAPVVYADLENSILRSLVPLQDFALETIDFYNASNIFAYARGTNFIYYICFVFPRVSQACGATLNLLYGENPEGSSPSLFPALLAHNGYSMSLKSAVHYGQIYSSGRFQMFDYGEGNNYYYNSTIPPEYPIENILTPMYFFHGTPDILGTVKDALRAYSVLRPEVRYGITEVNYNHLNIMYGSNIYESIVLPTIKIIENFPNKK